MKKVKYPNLNDYDLSAYEELKGDILYKINGGVVMSEADRQAMAQAGANNDKAAQEEILKKYESTETPSSTPPATTQTTPPPTSTTPPATNTTPNTNNPTTSPTTTTEKPKQNPKPSTTSGGSTDGGTTTPTNNNTINNNGYPSYVDPTNKTVNANINSNKSVEEAFSAYYILSDKGYTFRLVDGSNVVHTFSSVEAAAKYVKSLEIKNDSVDKAEIDKYSIIGKDKNVQFEMQMIDSQKKGSKNGIEYGLQSGYVEDLEGAYGMGHAGWFTQINNNFNFFEITGISESTNGIDENTAPGTTLVDKWGSETTVLSNSPVKFPTPGSAKSSGNDTNAACLVRVYKSKDEMKNHLKQMGFDQMVVFNQTSLENSYIYEGSVENGVNFKGYQLLNNSCGIIARKSLTVDGSGINSISTNTRPSFFSYAIPNEIGNTLYTGNLGKSFLVDLRE